ncbi:MAG TPA: hypothetical protein VK714_15695 [Myxococcota bacterium]|nr:hypothetical protein [Myxococcota bacterium]
MGWLGLPLLVCGAAALSAEGPRAACFEPNAGNRLIEFFGCEKGSSAVPPACAGRRFYKAPAWPSLACAIDFSSLEGKIT